MIICQQTHGFLEVRINISLSHLHSIFASNYKTVLVIYLDRIRCELEFEIVVQFTK